MGRTFTNLHIRTAAATSAGTFCGGSRSKLWLIDLRSVAPDAAGLKKFESDPHPCKRCGKSFYARKAAGALGVGDKIKTETKAKTKTGKVAKSKSKPKSAKLAKKATKPTTVTKTSKVTKPSKSSKSASKPKAAMKTKKTTKAAKTSTDTAVADPAVGLEGSGTGNDTDIAA